MRMIAIAPDKKWSSLTARERTPFVLREVLQVALLAAALADIYRPPGRGDPRQEVAVERGGAGELYGRRSYRVFRLRSEARLMGLELGRNER